MADGDKQYKHHEYCLLTKFNGKIPTISRKNPIVVCRQDEVERAEKKLDPWKAVVPYRRFFSAPKNFTYSNLFSVFRPIDLIK